MVQQKTPPPKMNTVGMMKRTAVSAVACAQSIEVKASMASRCGIASPTYPDWKYTYAWKLSPHSCRKAMASTR